MKKTIIVTVLLAGTLLLWGQKTPNVRAWNPDNMAKVKKMIRQEPYKTAYESLIKEADKELSKGPYSVMDKTMTPPSGDKHDYLSMGPYWWPNPDTEDGLPYIRKDGLRNPELNNLDAPQKSRMINSSVTLALAWYFSNDIKYAEKAAEIIDAWFLDPETRMNPNLDYGQYIPGVSAGRGIGIIETYDFVHLTDAIELLNQSKALSGKQYNELKKWFSDFETWLTDSKNGKDEEKTLNNHGLAYDVQLAAIAMFTGNETLYKRIINNFPERRIYPQVEPDGSQPLELERTLSYSYSRFNIKHMFDMAELAQRSGIDLMKAVSADGRSIKAALDYLLPYIGKEEEWPYRQIKDWDKIDAEVCWLLRRMTLMSGDKNYEAERIKFNKNKAKDREVLLYSLQ